MRVLWFTNTASLYETDNCSYHGGGWINSLEKLIRKEKDIQLAISFFHPCDSKKVTRDNTIYYPIKRKSPRYTPLKTLINNWTYSIESEKYVKNFLNAIEDFKPDVIHVFGTEGAFGLIQKYTEIPVVIHLQGLLNPIVDSYYPPGQSSYNFLLSRKYIIKNLLGNGVVSTEKRIRRQAIREREHFRNAKFIMGRTEWDRSISMLLAPQATYFHINEVLRDPFYSEYQKSVKLDKALKIVSTISPNTYKGIDVILKTAALLKVETNIEFKWKVFGLDGNSKLLQHFEKEFKIKHTKVNVEFIGVKMPSELISVFLGSDLFVHPSYIDNSPNSLCEAQMLGLPVISANAGGIPSLIEHKESGILVPINGSFEIVSAISDFYKFPEKYNVIAKKGRESANLRHNRNEIIKELKVVYKQISNS